MRAAQCHRVIARATSAEVLIYASVPRALTHVRGTGPPCQRTRHISNRGPQVHASCRCGTMRRKSAPLHLDNHSCAPIVAQLLMCRRSPLSCCNRTSKARHTSWWASASCLGVSSLFYSLHRSAHQVIVPERILCRHRPVQVLVDGGYPGRLFQGRFPPTGRPCLQPMQVAHVIAHCIPVHGSPDEHACMPSCMNVH